MNQEEREGLMKFCVMATADLHGMEIQDVEVDKFAKMSDEELKKEADWLDDMLAK